jgi:hypothetical protein
MKTRLMLLGVALCCAAMLVPAPVRAQSDGALLDALVKKGVLSDQEAEDIRADEEKDYASTAASKINLSSSIKTITFYGDLRLRYEMRNATIGVGDVVSGGGLAAHTDSQTRNRWRYRLRFGFKGDLYDNFSYGVRFATNPYYDRSGNVTFGDSDSAGPFGKSRSLIAVDQVWLAYKPTSEITLTGGQMPQPFYTTGMVWDDNLNPTGATEQYDKTFDNGLELFGTLGQLIYGTGADNAIGGAPTQSAIFMFGEQAGIKYKFDDDTAFKIAATMYEYSGNSNGNPANVEALYGTNPLNENGGYFGTGATLPNANSSPQYFNGPFVGAASAPYSNVSGINDLLVLETPFEFDFKEWGVPMRLFGDFAYNFEAGDRADAARGAINTLNTLGVESGATPAGTPATATQIGSPAYQGVLNTGKGFLDQAAYQIGFEAGQLKKKGDWDTKLYWQSTGYYAVDPNLIDSDIFNAATNMQGVVVAASYNWTDGLTSTVRYAHGMPVNGRLATPNVNQDIQTSDMKTYDLFQADLMWKF